MLPSAGTEAVKALIDWLAKTVAKPTRRPSAV
jgi:hypothetical protein